MGKVSKPILEERPGKNGTIGERINYIRRKRNITQEKLAENIHVDVQTIKRYEAGTTSIKAEKLAEIAKVLEIPADYLLGINEIENYKIEDKAICKKIGINSLALNILKYYHKNGINYLSDVINFLIEQEKPMRSSFGFSLPKECTEEQLKKAEEKAEEEYNKYVENFNQKYISILGTIHSYYSVKVKEEEIKIIDHSMDNILGTDELGEELAPKIVVSNQDIVDREYLLRIQSKLEKSKEKFVKRYISK